MKKSKRLEEKRYPTQDFNAANSMGIQSIFLNYEKRR